LKPRRRKKKSRFNITFLIPILFLFAIFWVWKSGEIDKLSRRCSSLEKHKDQLQDQNKTLQIKLERLKSIAHVDKVVRDYGLTPNVKSRTVLFDNKEVAKRPNRSMFIFIWDVFQKLYEKFRERL